MRVFHLLSGAPFGSVERQLERLAALLERNGVRQEVLLGCNPARAQRLAALGAMPTEIRFPGRFAFMDRRRINGAIRRFGPDIVLSWTSDVAGTVEKGAFIHMGRIGAAPDFSALASCRHLFTPASARGDAALAAGWANYRVHVLPHIPRLDATAASAVARKTYYTPPSAKLVVTALRLVRNCGLETLLDAIARLSGYYLWIAGDGADREALEHLAHERGVKPRVRFLGWQDALAPVIAAADVFVHPARQEDVADAVVEAWECGAPVVAADSLGPGLLIRHRENGVLVPVGDAVSMAEAIRWVCQDGSLARRLGEAGRAAFAESFSAEKVAARYVDLLARLAATPDAY